MTIHQLIGGFADPTSRRTAGFALTLATILALATPSLAQTPPEKPHPEKAHSGAIKKKQKPAPVPAPGAMPAPSQASGNAQAIQAQNPLTPLWSILNENYTNNGYGPPPIPIPGVPKPLRRTQNVLIVEPILPLKLSPDWNLITRWNSPVISQPRLFPSAPPPFPGAPAFPGIGPEFGLGNMQPQFFVTPAHPGSYIFWCGTRTVVTDRDRQNVGDQQDRWRTGFRRADNPGTFACRVPCPKHLGGHDRHERDRNAREHADHYAIYLLQFA